MQRSSGADIVSLYLFDPDAQEYYAPVAIGLPEDGLLALDPWLPVLDWPALGLLLCPAEFDPAD